MTDQRNSSDEIEDNKNKKSIHCQYCNSTILKAKKAFYTVIEVSIARDHCCGTSMLIQIFVCILVQAAIDAPKEQGVSHGDRDHQRVLARGRHVHLREYRIFKHHREHQIFDMR